MSEPRPTRPGVWRELAGVFLRLGTTAFGGPAAHVAMMEQEFVRRRGWVTHEEFLDMLGTVNLIPGPNSTEMAIFLGYRRGGWMGLVLGGTCFILPAMIIVGVIAWAYTRFGGLPRVAGLLYGVKPVIIAIILQALWKLGRVAVKSRWLAVAGIVGTALSFLGVNLLVVLFGTGLIMMAGRWLAQGRGRATGIVPLLGGTPFVAGGAAAVVPFGLWALFVFFLKVGAVLFGSGYVLLAFLRADLVERWHWLTTSQLLDAVAVGQVTPGPVFTTATFIGYVLGGVPGAVVATVGIFLPAFVLVAASGPLVRRLRQSTLAGAFLDGVNVASLALMAVVTWQLGRAALVDWLTVALAAVSAVVLLCWRINSSWLVLGGLIAGGASSWLAGR